MLIRDEQAYRESRARAGIQHERDIPIPLDFAIALLAVVDAADDHDVGCIACGVTLSDVALSQELASCRQQFATQVAAFERVVVERDSFSRELERRTSMLGQASGMIDELRQQLSKQVDAYADLLRTTEVR